MKGETRCVDVATHKGTTPISRPISASAQTAAAKAATQSGRT
jgi:hypothetical protein